MEVSKIRLGITFFENGTSIGKFLLRTKYQKTLKIIFTCPSHLQSYVSTIRELTAEHSASASSLCYFVVCLDSDIGVTRQMHA